MSSFNIKENSDRADDSIRILHIDDEESFSDLLKEYLRKIDPDLVIDTLTNPIQALSQLGMEDNYYNVVICDYQMPSMNGLELLAELRRWGNRIPFIVLTGKGREEVVIQALNLGADFYLQKSGNFRILFTELYHFILRATEEKKIAKALRASKGLLKETEKAAQAIEKRYRSLFNRVPIGLYRTTPNGRILDANPAMLNILGYNSLDEFRAIDLESSDIYDRYPRTRFKTLIEQDNEVRDFIATWTKTDGTKLIIRENAIAIRDDSGKIVYYEGSIEDITDKALAEKALKESEFKHRLAVEALRESEKKYRFIAENTREGITIVDFQECFTYSNSAADEMFGVYPESLVGRNLQEFVNPETYGFFQDQTELRKAGLENSYEFDLIRPDGEPRRIKATITPYIDENDEFLGSYGILRDITNQRIAEKILKEKMEEIELYLNVLTHDLNNYVHTSIGYHEFIIENLSITLSQDIASALQSSIAGLTNAKTLLSNISVLMKESLPHSYDLHPIDILQTISKVHRTILESFPERTIDITTENIMPGDTILADMLLEQLILNLLTNAVKNDEHEIVEIKIALSCNHDTKRCTLAIVDQSKGIHPEKRKELFEKFSEFRKKGKGSGLGLFIVKTLVDRYKGRIWIENRIPEDYTKGTIFKIKLQLP